MFLRTLHLFALSHSIAAISSHSPLDLLANPKYTVGLSSEILSNASALDILAAPPSQEQTVHLMRTNKGKAFICYVPKPPNIPPPPPEEKPTLSKEELEVQRKQQDEQHKYGLERGLALLEPLKSNCLYYTSGWFTYSFCHGNEIRQYRAARVAGAATPAEDPNYDAFTLGQYSVPYDYGKSEAKGDPKLVEGSGGVSVSGLREVLGDGATDAEDQVNTKRYVMQKWGGGTICDKTGMERRIEIQFHCNAQAMDRVSLIRETAMCEYIMVVQTPRLCGEAMFLPEDSSTHAVKRKLLDIECKAVDNGDGPAQVEATPPQDLPPVLQDIPVPKPETETETSTPTQPVEQPQTPQEPKAETVPTNGDTPITDGQLAEDEIWEDLEDFEEIPIMPKQGSKQANQWDDVIQKLVDQGAQVVDTTIEVVQQEDGTFAFKKVGGEDINLNTPKPKQEEEASEQKKESLEDILGRSIQNALLEHLKKAPKDLGGPAIKHKEFVSLDPKKLVKQKPRDLRTAQRKALDDMYNGKEEKKKRHDEL